MCRRDCHQTELATWNILYIVSTADFKSNLQAHLRTPGLSHNQIPKKPKHLDAEIVQTNKYRGNPSPEIDAEWLKNRSRNPSHQTRWWRSQAVEQVRYTRQTSPLCTRGIRWRLLGPCWKGFICCITWIRWERRWIRNIMRMKGRRLVRVQWERMMVSLYGLKNGLRALTRYRALHWYAPGTYQMHKWRDANHFV